MCDVSARWRTSIEIEMPVDARAEGVRRPVVVVLGGGFAGVGAARKLKKADADVVVVDKHDYHTFQPLLYQLATGLLETSAVGHSLRDLVHDQDNVTIHKTSVTAIDLDAREVRFARDGASDVRLPRARARRGGQLLRNRRRSGARLPDVHTHRRRSPQGAHARAVGGRRQGPEPDGGRRPERGRGRRRTYGRRECRRNCRALSRRLREGLPGRLAGARARGARRGGLRGLLDVQAEPPRVHAKKLCRSAPSR